MNYSQQNNNATKQKKNVGKEKENKQGWKGKARVLSFWLEIEQLCSRSWLESKRANQHLMWPVDSRHCALQLKVVLQKYLGRNSYVFIWCSIFPSLFVNILQSISFLNSGAHMQKEQFGTLIFEPFWGNSEQTCWVRVPISITLVLINEFIEKTFVHHSGLV